MAEISRIQSLNLGLIEGIGYSLAFSKGMLIKLFCFVLKVNSFLKKKGE